jgi:2',3'-cyclic-nucleotide 2'-phosphodiesterase/3'-nucleotidase
MLRMALEQCATYFAVGADGVVTIAEPFLSPKVAHYNYDFFAGVAYAFDLRRPAGERVSRLAYEGRPVADDERFSLVMNNYRATGAGDFDFYADCERIREIQTEVSELILDYISARDVVTVPESSPYTVTMPDGTTA